MMKRLSLMILLCPSLHAMNTIENCMGPALYSMDIIDYAGCVMFGFGSGFYMGKYTEQDRKLEDLIKKNCITSAKVGDILKKESKNLVGECDDLHNGKSNLSNNELRELVERSKTNLRKHKEKNQLDKQLLKYIRPYLRKKLMAKFCIIAGTVLCVRTLIKFHEGK